MKAKNVVVLRGTPSAGKNSVAALFADSVVVSADDFFYDRDLNYKFDASKLGFAHAQCREVFLDALHNGSWGTIVVANTNSKESEFKFYQEEALAHGHFFFSLVVERRHDNKNSHNVPDETVARMASNIKNSLKLI